MSFRSECLNSWRTTGCYDVFLLNVVLAQNRPESIKYSLEFTDNSEIKECIYKRVFIFQFFFLFIFFILSPPSLVCL